MARKSSKQSQQSKKWGCRGCISTILGVIVIAVIVIISMATGIDPEVLLDIVLGTEPAPSVGPAVNTVEGEWWHLYFTEPVGKKDPALFNNGIDQHLVQAIDEAQRTIDIAVYELNLDSITDALIRAKQRGVQVRLVTDDEHGLDDEDGTIGRLIQAGIVVVDDDDHDFMHDKFVIIDGAQVWTGSWNFTQNGTFLNNNNAIAIDSTALADIYTREFEEMFEAQSFGGRSPTFTDPNTQKVIVNQTPIQVYFGPEDDVGDKIVALIADARESVRFMAFAFTHDKIGETLNNRAAAGVLVEGIFEERGSQTQYSELPYLFCQSLPVRWDGNSYVLHHKVFIIDDEIVVTGSFNFSKQADTANDENVLIIRDTEIAAQYRAEFDRRWAESEVPEGIDCR